MKSTQLFKLLFYQGETGSDFFRVRPAVTPEVKAADSSTSLANIIDGVPATDLKIGFIGCGIMGKFYMIQKF